MPFKQYPTDYKALELYREKQVNIYLKIIKLFLTQENLKYRKGQASIRIFLQEQKQGK